MKLLKKALMVVDFETDTVSKKIIPPAFDVYVNNMINTLNEKTDVKSYKTKSVNTEVISAIVDIKRKARDKDFNEVFDNKSEVIANRLKNVEKDVQEKINKLNQKVRKGSFIQVLYEDGDTLNYLLAKAQHTGFIDENDYSSKKGFPDDKFIFWRYCIFDITNEETDFYNATVYTDHEIKYWADDFLELEELETDENNTKKSFGSLDNLLAQNIKQKSPHDYLVLRNNLIHYYRSNPQISYGEMVISVFKNYEPQEIESNDYVKLLKKVSELPKKRKFDTQFASKPNVIKAKIRKIYDVMQGVQLKVTDSFENLENVMFSKEDNYGNKYIMLKTDNIELYDMLKRNK